MIVKDRRFHSPEREKWEAEAELRELANKAEEMHWCRPCRFDCTHTDHPHAKPGWMIERQSKIVRDKLKKLESE